jgi:hypothetical protein
MLCAVAVVDMGEEANRRVCRAETGEKKPGVARLFFLDLAQLGKNGITEAATDLGQFCQRKFLNFNNGFNNCRVHGNSSSEKVLTRITVAAQTTLGASFRGK